MKKLLIILLFLLTMVILTGNLWASSPKVLINVVQEKGDTVSSALIRETEMIIARELLNRDFDIMTSDDLSAAGGLTRQDVESARAGGMSELRKAAALNNAAFVISAKADTRISQEEVLGMQMSKAVTSVAYRIVNTATGRTVDMDSISFTTAGRSGQESTHSNYQKMSEELVTIAADKIPSSLSAQDSRQLTSYKASLTPKPAARPQPAPAPQPAAPEPKPEPPAEIAVAKASPEPAKTEVQTTPPVSDGPELIILNPPATRGFIPVARQSDITIEGMAIDPGGIAEVRINGEMVPHDNEGRFKQEVALRHGENRVLVMAVNTAGRMATKDLTLDRARDTDPPELVILRPQVTRGFQVALRPEVKTTVIEGIVRDESDILFVRVNDQDVSFSETGHFLHEINLEDSTSSLSIEAADIHGNITRKALEIARGEDSWALSPSMAASGMPGPPGKPVLWGLAIGVSKYTSTSISLKYADQDALKLERFFKSHEGKSFSEVHFKTLINENVTRNSIIEGITTHLGKAAPNDIIFIFMAGHGIKHRQSGSYYFMPSDSDFSNLLSTGLRMSDFEESVRILSQNVDKIIVAMDTCHAGALEVGMRSVGGGEDLAGAISAASGMYILSASKAGEVSLESHEFRLDPDFTGHGAFTYSLVHAMRGEADYDQDGYVSLNEMFQFVSRQVPRLTNGQQHPYFRMQGTDLPLVRIQ